MASDFAGTDNSAIVLRERGFSSVEYPRTPSPYLFFGTRPEATRVFAPFHRLQLLKEENRENERWSRTHKIQRLASESAKRVMR